MLNVFNSKSPCIIKALQFCFDRFGKNAKIVHFIGGTKPWLQYFDIETRTVHPSHELQHMKEVLQYWWNIFCNSVHPSLSNEMTNPSTSTSAAGFDSFLQNVTHTSYYYLFESQNTNVAGDYTNVWDPWEEYLEKVTHNQSSSSTVYNEPSQYDSSDHNHPNQDHEDMCHLNDHHHFGEEIHKTEAIARQDHSDMSQLIEPHNTNTEFAHHYNEKLSPPTYSQPQRGSSNVHYDPAPTPVHQPDMAQPPSSLPPSSEPNQCVATMVVSNETSLHCRQGDEQNDDSGFAGAFAKLTLGVARTPEQAALDDHLRRQGWEVGNIDYLGRDSFDNIWSKICETLAAAPPESAPKPKETTHPELPKEKAPTTESSKTAEPAATPDSVIQSSKPRETPVTDPTTVLPVDVNASCAAPQKEGGSEILACPLAMAEEPVCSVPIKPELPVTTLPEPVSVGPSPALGPIPSESPLSPSAVPTSQGGHASSITSSIPETPLTICAPPPLTSEPATASIPTSTPQSPQPTLTPESPPLDATPQSPALTSQIPAAASMPQTDVISQSRQPASTPESPAPASVSQSDTSAPDSLTSASDTITQSSQPTPTPPTLASAAIPHSTAPASAPQSSALAPTQQNAAPALTPQSPAPDLTPQSPAPASVPQTVTSAPDSLTSASDTVPQRPQPTSTPLTLASAPIPQSPAPASIPQSDTSASDSLISKPDVVLQSPQVASTPLSPISAPIPQSPSPASEPQSVTPASDSLISASDAVLQSPQVAPTPLSPAPASKQQTVTPASDSLISAPDADLQIPQPPSTAQKPAPAGETPLDVTPSAKDPSKAEAANKESVPAGISVSQAPKDSATEVPTAKPEEACQKSKEKQEKAAEQASSGTAGPTPPPRKGSGPKKSGGKGKK
nr:unnamed protein product [Callosobruchus analis]